MCDKRDRSITGDYCLDLHLTLMFSGLLRKDLSKEGKVGRKVFSNMSHKVCRLLSSPVLLRKFTIIENEDFFLRFQKQNTRPNVPYSNRFRPSTRKRLINGNTTASLTEHAQF